MFRRVIVRTRELVARHWSIIALLALFGIIYGASLNSYGMFLWDESEYASIARSVLQGHGFAIVDTPNALRPPILPLAGAVSMLLTGDQFDDASLRKVAYVFALLALLCVYGFATAAVDRTAGLVAAALLGISPFFWIFVPHFLCEIPFLAFFAAAVWLFYLGAYRDKRFFVWSWICWALSLLTRYTAALFLPVIVSFIPMALWLGGPDTRRRFMSRTFLFSPLAGFLVLAPWLIREYATFGNPLVGVIQSSHQLQDYLPGVSMPWHSYLDWLPVMLSPAITFLSVACVIWALWKRDSFVLYNALAAVVILVWFSCYRYKEQRMVSSALPFMAVIAAIALWKATANLRPLLRGAALGVALTALFVLNLRVTRPVLEHMLTLGYPSFLDAMAYLRLQASPGAVALGANVPQIHWYSGLRAVNFPAEDELPQALRHSEWVVITNFEPVQKPYVLRLPDRVTQWTPESAVRFEDREFVTVVIRSDLLLRSFAH